jgi:ABC-2 type transport system permease protein
MNKTLSQTWYIFLQLIQREAYVYSRHIKRYITNYVLIYPFLYAIAFAYIQSRAYFGQQDAKMSTLLFAGNVIIPLMGTAFHMAFEVFFDLLGNKFITYQTTILRPELVILARILFAWILIFCLMLPFYPLGKLFLGSFLDTSATNWFYIALVLLASSLMCVSYHMLAAVYFTKISQIELLWARINLPMFTLGGFWIPRNIIYKFSPTLGTLLYLNPVIYVTEGLRQAMIGGPQFLPLWVCITALFGFSFIFILLTWYTFKKRIDHI